MLNITSHYVEHNKSLCSACEKVTFLLKIKVEIANYTIKIKKCYAHFAFLCAIFFVISHY